MYHQLLLGTKTQSVSPLTLFNKREREATRLTDDLKLKAWRVASKVSLPPRGICGRMVTKRVSAHNLPDKGFSHSWRHSNAPLTIQLVNWQDKLNLQQNDLLAFT